MRRNHTTIKDRRCAQAQPQRAVTPDDTNVDLLLPPPVDPERLAPRKRRRGGLICDAPLGLKN